MALAIALSTAVVVVLSPTPVGAAPGTLAGPAQVKEPGSPGQGGIDLPSGDSSTAFALRLPLNAACPLDTASGNWNWSTYMVPASVNPADLKFDSTGPTPQGVGVDFRQPLYTPGGGSPLVQQATDPADDPGGPGLITFVPNASYEVVPPGFILAGVYNIGVACHIGPPSNPDQLGPFWNVQKTFSTNPTGGPAQVDWFVGAVPAAPTLDSLTPGDGSLTAGFTPTPSDPATTDFTATATPTAGGASVTASGPSSPILINGLTNGTSYDVTVRATNSVGDSAESNVLMGTPVLGARPPVQNLIAVPGTNRVDLTWDAPTGDVPTSYDVAVSPAEGTPSIAGTTAAVTGLTAGTNYLFTVTPLHPAPFVGTAVQVSATPFAAQVVVQQVSVVRPAGALILTQICGKNGPIPAETASDGFPDGLPAVAASDPAGHSGPTLTANGTDTDPNFTNGEYPDPASPNYPTHCGIDLGTATRVKAGPAAGQFFAADGLLNQVTIVDTRDTDAGWAVTATMGTFSAGPASSFSGDQLGWNPQVTSDTNPGGGGTYDQIATPGLPVDPNTVGGLGAGATLASALAGEGLGAAELDARLKILIPIATPTGAYQGNLTLTVA